MMIMSSFDPLDLSSKNSECVSTLSTKQFLFHLAFIQVWEVQVPWIFTGAGAVSRHVVISWGCGFSETTFDLKTLLSWPFSTRDNLLANGRYGSRGTIFSDEPILALSKEIYNYIYIILWDSNILFHIISGTTYIYIYLFVYTYIITNTRKTFAWLLSGLWLIFANQWWWWWTGLSNRELTYGKNESIYTKTNW